VTVKPFATPVWFEVSVKNVPLVLLIMFADTGEPDVPFIASARPCRVLLEDVIFIVRGVEPDEFGVMVNVPCPMVALADEKL
jgi:hypothetical protein